MGKRDERKSSQNPPVLTCMWSVSCMQVYMQYFSTLTSPAQTVCHTQVLLCLLPTAVTLLKLSLPRVLLPSKVIPAWVLGRATENCPWACPLSTAHPWSPEAGTPQELAVGTGE